VHAAWGLRRWTVHALGSEEMRCWEEDSELIVAQELGAQCEQLALSMLASPVPDALCQRSMMTLNEKWSHPEQQHGRYQDFDVSVRLHHTGHWRVCVILVIIRECTYARVLAKYKE
jgi:hypothetical protein